MYTFYIAKHIYKIKTIAKLIKNVWIRMNKTEYDPIGEGMNRNELNSIGSNMYRNEWE